MSVRLTLGPSGDAPLRKPITGFADCCARAPSGHANAPPPSAVIKLAGVRDNVAADVQYTLHDSVDLEVRPDSRGWTITKKPRLLAKHETWDCCPIILSDVGVVLRRVIDSAGRLGIWVHRRCATHKAAKREAGKKQFRAHR